MDAVCLVVAVVDRLFPKFSYKWLADEVERNLPQELDFLHEASNASRWGEESALWTGLDGGGGEAGVRGRRGSVREKTTQSRGGRAGSVEIWRGGGSQDDEKGQTRARKKKRASTCQVKGVCCYLLFRYKDPKNGRQRHRGIGPKRARASVLVRQ